jgi:hypothetical protein
MEKQKIYICVSYSIESPDPYVELFSDEKFAYEHACEMAKESMEEYGCDDVDSSDYDTYIELCDNISLKNFEKALSIYDYWNDDLDYETRFNIEVYGRDVLINLDKVEGHSSDILCKKCGNKISVDDRVCWWCQTPNDR